MSGKGTLPIGWSTTALGQVRVDTSRTIDPSKAPSEYFELYSIPAFPSGRPEIVNGKTIGSTKQTLDVGTVVVAKINPRINRVWVVDNHSGHQQIGSSEWIPFFPVAGIDPHYLAYSMRQDAFRNYLAANVSGVGGSLMRVRPATVDPYPFVVAPQAEQHRIVEAIESYFTRLDDAVATLDRVQRNLKRYRASVLKAAIEGRLVPSEAELARTEGRDYEPASVLLERILTERRRRWEEAELAKMKAKGKAARDDKWKMKYEEPVAPNTADLPELPAGWSWASVAQLGFIASGQTPKGVTSAGAKEGDVPWFRVGDMNTEGNDLHMSIAEEWLTDDQVAALALHIRPAGTIVFPKRGGAIGTNKKRLLALPGTYDLNTMGIVPIANIGPFLWTWFLSVDLGSLADGSNVPQINHGDIAPLPVPLAPEQEQTRIVNQVNTLLSIADAAVSAVSTNRLRVRRLRQSVLKWAFEGKLVDQDPTDEPASRLLERIKAEREAADGKKRTTRGRRKARLTKA